jgi:hypothetical protein
MAITGIPNYTGALPVEYSLRCACKLRYVVFTGKGAMIGDAKARAEERAAEMRAVFVDAREIPFMICECNQVLDFLPDGSVAVN